MTDAPNLHALGPCDAYGCARSGEYHAGDDLRLPVEERPRLCWDHARHYTPPADDPVRIADGTPVPAAAGASVPCPRCYGAGNEVAPVSGRVRTCQVCRGTGEATT